MASPLLVRLDDWFGLLGQIWRKKRSPLSAVSKQLRIESLEVRQLLSATPPTLYWDPSAANAPGGSGTWDTTTANWNTKANGLGSQTQWTNGDIAVFGSTGAAASTVNLASGTIYAASIEFTAGSYTITNNPLTLAAGGTTFERRQRTDGEHRFRDYGRRWPDENRFGQADPQRGQYLQRRNHAQCRDATGRLGNGRGRHQQQALGYLSGGEVPESGPLVVDGGELDLDGNNLTVASFNSDPSATAAVVTNSSATLATLGIDGGYAWDYFYGKLEGNMGLTIVAPPSGESPAALYLGSNQNSYSGPTTIQAVSTGPQATLAAVATDALSPYSPPVTVRLRELPRSGRLQLHD